MKRSIKASTIIIISIMFIILVLLFSALIYQENTNGFLSYAFNFNNGIKFIIFILIISAILLMYKLVKDIYTDRHNEYANMMSSNYFEIDFNKKKDPMKTVDIAIDYDSSNPTQSSTESIVDKKEYDLTPSLKLSDDPEDQKTVKLIEGAMEDVDEDEKPSPYGKSRFYKLTELEEKYKEYEIPDYDNNITLKEVCEQFRNFAASDVSHLYYSIQDIRRFIGGLAVTKLMILQGMSGTGKTSIAVNFGKFIGNKTRVIPIQPMWKERTDLIGYYNEFTRRFNETDLLETMYESNLNDEIFIVVLDEMNIARVEYYFAEFLSLLELPDLKQRLLDVVADKWPNDPKELNVQGKILMKDNVWFIGTANNDDSTFAISDKVYDRAMVLNLDKRATTFDAPPTPGLKISATHLKELFAKAQKEYAMSERNLRKIKTLDEYMIKTFHLTFGNRIMKQIREYVPVLVACGGEELEAIDDILARKVFRKLEAKNPVAVQQLADSLCEFLDQTFGVDKLELSKETIMTIKQSV